MCGLELLYQSLPTWGFLEHDTPSQQESRTNSQQATKCIDLPAKLPYLARFFLQNQAGEPVKPV